MRVTLSNFYFGLRYSFLILLIPFLCSCTTNRIVTERALPVKEIALNINEVKLGASQFYLRIPNSFKVIEARGKEGQHGFHILPKDTSSKMFGFIEIAHGLPIGDSATVQRIPKEYVQSTFLNLQTKWAIYVTETGYFDAETPRNRGISAEAISNKRNDIDSLISIIGTLSER